MNRINGKIAPTQNIGLVDRMVRFFGGGALMAYGVISILLAGQSIVSAVAILLAVYPLMTTMMGWDPFYELFGARSCHVEGGEGASVKQGVAAASATPAAAGSSSAGPASGSSS